MSGFVHAQSAAAGVERNRITISGGWARQLYPGFSQRETAPAMGLSYGYRPLKFVEFEAGVVVALGPARDQCHSFGCLDVNDLFIWAPFGVRFLAPLVAGRLELSAGGGGIYEKYSVSNQFGGSRGGFGGYFSGGAAVALDHRRHFWVGATPRVILANPPFARDRWFTITGDLGFRF